MKTKELYFGQISARLNKIEHKRIFPCENEQRMMKSITVPSLLYPVQNDSTLKKNNIKIHEDKKAGTLTFQACVHNGTKGALKVEYGYNLDGPLKRLKDTRTRDTKLDCLTKGHSYK